MNVESPDIPPLLGSFETIADAFEAVAEQFGDRIAYVDGVSGGERITFGEWHRRSDALAGFLVEQGVRPGDVVAIMLRSSIEYAVALGATMLAGAVATGINERLGAREITSILDRAAARLTFHDREAFADVQPDGCVIVTPTDLAAAAHHPPLGARRPRAQRGDPVVIIWTSGTTGNPKGAWFDHGNLEAAVASAGVMSEPFDIKLISTPFPHAGYMSKMWDQLAWVTTSVISPSPWKASDMLRLMVDERITVVTGVPTQWSKLLDEPGIDSADLSSVRLGLTATAPASPELIERVASTIGCPLVVRYSMTECPSVTGTDVSDPPEVQFRTVGRVQAGMSIMIVDDDGREVAAGSVGRLRVQGRCVMQGYWGDPDLTASIRDDFGWLTTSDLVIVRDDGNLVLVGRTSDMYIRGGYNIYPLEVENVLAEHPSVERAAIVGVPADVIGEIGVAFVVAVDPAHPPSLDALRSFVRQRLADYKAPDRLEIIDALPLTSMMKIDRPALQQLAESADGLVAGS